MKFLQPIVFLAILVFSVASCATDSTSNTNANVNLAVTTNTNSINNVSINANSIAPAASPTTANSAAANSPTTAANAYYQAMLKKDEAAFRKTLSQATLREFSADAEAGGDKTLVGYWTDFGDLPSKFEARNEQVAGDTALVEIKNEAGIWQLNKLVRENNEWKMDLTRATTTALEKRSTGK